MTLWRTNSRLPLILDALGATEEDPRVELLITAFGGHPAKVIERLIGEPARRTRWLRFASGGEIILHDGAVVAVVLHVRPSAIANRGIDLGAWVDGVGNDTTLDQLKAALRAPRKFAGFGRPYFVLDAGYVQTTFVNDRGWKDPGNLVALTVTEHQPVSVCDPADDDCPSCADLLVRLPAADGIDVDTTINELQRAVSDGRIQESSAWVRLGDLRQLHDSGLMARVESQFTCSACHRVACFTLSRDAAATFGYYTLNEARQRPLEPIPQIGLWGDGDRISADVDEMHFVAHEPGRWFLVHQHDTLFLSARYVINTMLDDTAMIELNDTETAAYRAGGRTYIARLADKIHDGAPHQESSPYFSRNLLRGPDREAYRVALDRAMVNHTWLAQQRQRR